MSADQTSNEDAYRRISASDYHANLSEGGERLKFQVDITQYALKNLNLVNGGGILALLTLVGNSSAIYDHRSISWAFAWFALGLAFSLGAYLGAFVSQYQFMNATYKLAWNAQARSEGLAEPYDMRLNARFGNGALFFSISLAVLSLIFFIIGAFVALDGLF